MAEILRDYGDDYEIEFFEQFSQDYPTIRDLATQIGFSYDSETDPQYMKRLVRGRLGKIRTKYLISAEIQDITEPSTYNIYYAWKNEYLGQNIMRSEIAEHLESNGGEYGTFQAGDITMLTLPDDTVLVTIYDKFDYKHFNKIARTDLRFRNFTKVILVTHTIEMKYIYEKQVKRDLPQTTVHVYAYAMTDLRSLFNKIAAPIQVTA